MGLVTKTVKVKWHGKTRKHYESLGYVYTKKGDMLGVNFIIKNKNWEDKEGKKHYDYQFIATRVHFLHKADTTNNNKSVEKEEPKKDAYTEFGNSIKAEQIDKMTITDDDLPF